MGGSIGFAVGQSASKSTQIHKSHPPEADLGGAAFVLGGDGLDDGVAVCVYVCMHVGVCVRINWMCIRP